MSDIELAQKTKEFADLPANILGLDGWLLRSVPKDQREYFLRSHLKTLRAALHPDRCATSEGKESRERFISQLSQATEFLLSGELEYQTAADTVPTQTNPAIQLARKQQAMEERFCVMERDWEQREKSMRATVSEAVAKAERCKREADAEMQWSSAWAGVIKAMESRLRHQHWPLDTRCQLTGYWIDVARLGGWQFFYDSPGSGPTPPPLDKHINQLIRIGKRATIAVKERSVLRGGKNWWCIGCAWRHEFGLSIALARTYSTWATGDGVKELAKACNELRSHGLVTMPMFAVNTVAVFKNGDDIGLFLIEKIGLPESNRLARDESIRTMLTKAEARAATKTERRKIANANEKLRRLKRKERGERARERIRVAVDTKHKRNIRRINLLLAAVRKLSRGKNADKEMRDALTIKEKEIAISDDFNADTTQNPRTQPAPD